MEERSFRAACIYCIEEVGIVNFVNRHCNETKYMPLVQMCTYCGGEEDLIGYTQLVNHIMQCLESEYGKPFFDEEKENHKQLDENNEDYEEYITDGYTPSELLGQLNFETKNFRLHEDLLSSLNSKNLLWDSNFASINSLEFPWDEFKDFFTNGNSSSSLTNEIGSSYPKQLNYFFRILNQLMPMIEKHNLIKEINSDTLLYRCQELQQNKILNSKKFFGVPFKKHEDRKYEALNHNACSFFGNTDINTAVYKAYSLHKEGEKLSCETFSPSSSLSILDMTDGSLTPSLFIDSNPESREAMRLLQGFMRDLIDPQNHIDDNQDTNMPTKVVAEYLASNHIEGIMYPWSFYDTRSIVALILDPEKISGSVAENTDGKPKKIDLVESKELSAQEVLDLTRDRRDAWMFE